MIVGIPVVDGHDLTEVLLDSFEATVDEVNRPFRVVIIDNNSETPYKSADYEHYKFPVNVVEYAKNIGYYFPLRDLQQKFKDDYVGLIHNDMVIYKNGWNVRMEQEFEMDHKLGLIGLCGSYEADALGGRGGGTMCHFAGKSVQVGDRQILAQSQDAGVRIHGLRASLILDSLFMMFRSNAVHSLVRPADEKWEDITLAHFYDRIWPVRLIEAGWRVATMGVECDHLGGMTTTGNERYRQDCIDWLEERGLPYENPETEMYLIAERRWLGEYREGNKFLPAVIGEDYEITHRARH